MSAATDEKPARICNNTTFVEAPHLPEWWNQRRRVAWQHYLDTPPPTRKNENWRFAETKYLRLIENLCPSQPVSPHTRPTLIAKSQQTGGAENALRIVIANDTIIHFSREAENLPGLTILPWEKALTTHRSIIEKHFQNPPLHLGSERYTHLHAAMCTNGLLIHIAKNTELERDIEIHHWVAGQYTGTFSQLLIIGEPNTRATIIEHFHSADEHPAYLSNYTDLHAGPGSDLKLIRIQNLNRKSLCMKFLSGVAERDAHLLTCAVHLGSQFTRAENRTRLTAPGGSSDMLSIALTDGNQIIDQRTLQEHNAPNCRSDLLYKNALNHISKTIFSGLIRVAPGASGTDAYQTNRNLLLTERAEADSLPGLEILNDDVKCSHGATTGQVDPEQLFYLQTRGIPPRQAYRLLVLGFLEDVIARIQDEPLQKRLEALIEDKFSHMPDIVGDLPDTDEWAGSGAVGDIRALQGAEN